MTNSPVLKVECFWRVDLRNRPHKIAIFRSRLPFQKVKTIAPRVVLVVAIDIDAALSRLKTVRCLLPWHDKFLITTTSLALKGISAIFLNSSCIELLSACETNYRLSMS